MKYFKEQAFNSGTEVSFSKHRYYDNSFNQVKFLLRLIVFGIYYIIHNLLANILPKSKTALRYKITTSFGKGRFLFELKLFTNKDLWKYVKRENWLNEP